MKDRKEMLQKIKVKKKSLKKFVVLAKLMLKAGRFSVENLMKFPCSVVSLHICLRV